MQFLNNTILDSCGIRLFSYVQVSATDRDVDLNGRIRYALKDQIEAFVIDATSGIIRTASPLDRESAPSYEIQALAIDRGSPPLSSSVGANES